MKIIIDSRMRKIEKEYLSKYGELIEIIPQNNVYEEISAHPDIFFAKINNTIYEAPELNMNICEKGDNHIGKNYPDDIKYNICQIGNFVIHNFKYTDKKILNCIDKYGLEKINVKQGYSNCSISVISEKACITSDEGIYKALKMRNIDCLLMKENNIRLLDKNGLKTKMRGFIGGATCMIKDKFILFGDRKYLENREDLIEFLKKHKKELIDFRNLEIYDYGGIQIIDT